jgi:hypothetical protein
MRPWLVERGWGHQMQFEYVEPGSAVWNSHSCSWEFCPESDAGRRRVLRYLLKYLQKGYGDFGLKRKKFFFVCRSSRIGNTKFRWVPEVNPISMLWSKGREAFFELFERPARWWKDRKTVIWLGVRLTGWDQIDPLFWETQGAAFG